MKAVSFKKWFEVNEDSQDLHNTYQENISDLKDMGERIPSFKQWAKEYYNDLDPREIDFD